MKELIIVESPTKAKMIERFLEGRYNVISSMGHVRDLPSYRLGVNIDKDFEPEYEILKKKKKLLAEIKKLASKGGMIYLGMDEDREGEAIGWHLLQSLKLPDLEKRSERIVFHEVTKEALTDALKSPRKIDMNLVDAQQARRILDRVVGYKISPLLSRKIRRGLSAGRVQSVGLRMIVERERERLKFVPREYFSVAGEVSIDEKLIPVGLWGRSGKKYGKFDLGKKDADQAVKESLKGKLEIKKVSLKEKKLRALPPFITSTLQQEAYNKLKYTPARTMRIAQRLYEGIDMIDGRAGGLITYMRTDSVKVSPAASKKAADYIKKNFGDQYYPKKANVYKSRKSAQEAHECIRPTDLTLDPDSLEKSLSKEEMMLYKLIWERFVASQMVPAVISQKRVDGDAGDYNYRITGQSIVFDGYTRVWASGLSETLLPEINEGDKFYWKKLEALKHETKPPPRYTLATLVSELENNGIGRPSTYAT
ncbi:MAG: type I DNA topoisomerase, partial [Elusimicrobia bacterium]|nr:type I DNA topoisomerase [Elusimicrobiota bacterium]